MDFLLTKTPLIWLFQSYWRDEAFSVILAKKPFLELLSISAKDFSPPFYYLVLKFWMAIFGSSEIATRSLSVVAFLTLATILIMHFRRTEKLDYLKILIIGLAIISSPILTYYAFETRMYSLAAFFATCTWIALFTNKKKLFVLMSVLGLYTHYFQAFILFSQLIFVVWFEFVNANKPDFKTLLKSVYKNWGVQLITIIMLFAPWVFYVVINHTPSETSSFWIKKPSLELILNTPAILITGYEKDFNIKYGLSSISTLIYILIVTSCIKNFKNLKESVTNLATRHLAYILWFFLPAIFVSILSLFGPSLYLPRYLIVSSPALFFFIASELKNKRFLTSVFLIAIILFRTGNYQELQIKNRTKENLRSVFAKINSMTAKDDVLYLESELDFHLAQYYFKYPEKVYVVGKPYSELPSYVGKAMIPEGQVSMSRPDGETGVWLKSDRSTPKVK